MVSLAGLSQAFGNTSNPQYFVPSQSHSAALKLMLGQGKDARNVRVVIGEPGLGKTTLLLSLLEQFRGSALTVHLFFTQLGRGEFLCYVLGELGVVHPASDVRQAQQQLSGVLEREFRQGRKVIIAIDEAHDLDIEALCELAEVLDCDSARSKDLKVVLAGLPILSTKLASPPLQKLWERISEITSLSPLTREETVSYIHRRLQVSGYRDAIPFTPDAIATIATLADGIPRNINKLCSAGLFLAAGRSRTTIDSAIVVEASASWEGKSIAKKPLEEMFPSSAPALMLPPIDQLTSSFAEPPISQANLHDSVPAADDLTSMPAELRGESVNDIPMADRVLQWFGNTRLAWSGTFGELAAVVDARETDLAHALQQDCEQLRSLGIAVSLREPLGCARQVTLRKLPQPEQTSATETKREAEQTGAAENRGEPEQAATVETQHMPMAEAAAGPRPQLDSSRGFEEELPSNPQLTDRAPVEQGQIAAAQTAASESPDDLLDIFRANSERWSEPHQSRPRRTISAPLIVLVAIVIGIGSAYYALTKRKDSVVHWAQQFMHVKAPTKPILEGTTQPGAVANDAQTSSERGNLSRPELLPLVEQKPSPIEVLKKRGIRLDLAEDMKDFEQAAVSGDPNAQFELGAAYALGRGVPADAVTAYIWLTLAFANGKPQAESLLRELTRKINEPVIARIRWNLGQMYANGIGVRTDKIKAYMWQVLAASAGESRSSSAQSELAATMTTDEVYQAQLRASEWLNRHRRQGQPPL